MAAAVTAQTSEAGAREYWAKATAMHRPAYDRRGSRIVATDELAKAVTALAAEHGVELGPDHMRVDPAFDGGDVMAVTAVLNGKPVIIPIVPASAELRLYRPGDDHLVGELVATVTVPAELVEPGGWVPAAAIAEQLLALLVAPTEPS